MLMGLSIVEQHYHAVMEFLSDGVPAARASTRLDTAASGERAMVEPYPTETAATARSVVKAHTMARGSDGTVNPGRGSAAWAPS